MYITDDVDHPDMEIMTGQVLGKPGEGWHALLEISIRYKEGYCIECDESVVDRFSIEFNVHGPHIARLVVRDENLLRLNGNACVIEYAGQLTGKMLTVLEISLSE